ncbi:DUF1150 family protein [Nitrospirillum iridis]|uniref:DUF1150 family protein n=1 Tax=Nitrospirillum iridis TaxID=765888 RepID=A0A7X0B2I7_9PROT|nr:DUF1150 family protein [Nitrospirillum iridis]MBB6253510.1 hypothetical protein [Nitrospirillum iridis]
MTDSLDTDVTEALSADALRHLSSQDFAAFGVNVLAYVKPVVTQGILGYAIHAADGTPLAVAASPEVALASVRQHDMEPQRVH